MTPGDIGSAAIWLLIIGFAIVATMGSSRVESASEQAKKEEDAQRKMQFEQEEVQNLALIGQATALLPDADAALQKLKTKYTWAEITMCAGLDRKTRRAAREFVYKTSVSLPNMQRVPLGKEELVVVSAAKRNATDLDRMLSATAEELYEGFTVATLAAVEEWHFIEVSPRIDKTNRRYDIKATERGKQFARLDRLLMDPNDGLARPTSGPESRATKLAVASVVRKAIEACARAA